MRLAMKGAFSLPVLLLGLMKRGEKAAAAAGSTGAVAATTTSSATSAMIQAVPSVPSAAEAAVAIGSAAPTAIPVIAKAAVGIGLAAAVLTPSGDSAVHQAFDAYSAEDSAELLEGRSGTSLGTEELGNLPVVVEVSPAARTEPVEIADDATTDSFVPVQSSTATAAPASITVSSSGLEVVSLDLAAIR